MNPLLVTFKRLFRRAACFAPIAELDAELLALRLDTLAPIDVSNALVLARAPHDLDCPRIDGLTELIRARQAGHTSPGDGQIQPTKNFPTVALRRIA